MHVLVYHGTPRLYPEIGSASGSRSAALGLPGESDKEEMGIAAIRFPRPVRLAALRVIPAGVVHPSGVGETDSKSFTAELFLNVAPSDPVNALVRTSARVWSAEHALEYAIDMPEDTSTRLVIVRAPANKVTMSLYALDDAHAHTPAPTPTPPSPTSAPTTLPLPAATDLIAAIPRLHPTTPDIRARALATLAVIARRECILAAVLDPGHARALAAMEGSAPVVRAILGLEDTASDSIRSLDALTRLSTTPSAALHPTPESQLDLVLRLARAQMASLHPQAGAALSVVVARLGPLAQSEDGPVADRLARILPTLAVHATARGSYTPVPVPAAHARKVSSTLLAAAAETTVDGHACAPAATQLVRPFLAALEDEALRRAWEPAASTTSSPSLAPSSPGSPSPSPDTAITNLHRALSSTSSSLHLAPTPAEILSVVAPTLLTALSTAPAPPLGIAPALPRGGAGSASDYAGKVYSAHEFRRERDTVSGLGIGLAGVGRKASRHVDEFR